MPGAPRTCSASRTTSGTSPSGSRPTSSTTSSPSTPPAARPNPCMRCNERIKFAALLEKALALGFDAVVHRPLRRRSSTDAARQPRAAPRRAPGRRTSRYVLGVLTAEQLAHAYVPARRHPVEGRSCAPRPRAAGCRSRRSPTSHDICFIPDGDTRGWLAEQRRRWRRATSSTARAPSSARTRARTPSPSASAAACNLGTPARRRQAAVRARGAAEGEQGRRRARRRRSRSAEIAGSRFTWAGLPPADPADAVRLRGADPRARRPRAGGRGASPTASSSSPRSIRSTASPPARPPSSTSARACSASARSTAP